MTRFVHRNVVPASGLNLRASSSASAKVLATIPKGQPVTILNSEGSLQTVDGITAAWMQVTWNHLQGYIFARVFVPRATTDPNMPGGKARLALLWPPVDRHHPHADTSLRTGCG